MIALGLVRVIERHSDELAAELIAKLETSSRTTDLRKVPAEQLRQGIQEILRHLGEWLLTKTGHDIEQRYFEIGGRRASQGVDLSDFCWSYHRRSLRTHLHAKQACAILGKQACSMASKPMIVLRLRSFDSRRSSCGSPAKEKVPNRACLKAGRENPPLAAFMGLPVAE